MLPNLREGDPPSKWSKWNQRLLPVGLGWERFSRKNHLWCKLFEDPTWWAMADGCVFLSCKILQYFRTNCFWNRSHSFPKTSHKKKDPKIVTTYKLAICIQQLLFLPKNHQNFSVEKTCSPKLPRGIHHQHLDNEILCLAGEMTSVSWHHLEWQKLLEECCNAKVDESWPKLDPKLNCYYHDAPGRVKFPCLILRKRFGTSSGDSTDFGHNRENSGWIWPIQKFEWNWGM